jgi:hypothetical protein
MRVIKNKVGRWFPRARPQRAHSPFFPSAALSHTIRRMALIRFLAEAAMEWIRDTLVNASARIAEEFIGKRVKVSRKAKRRRKRARSRDVIAETRFPQQPHY